MLPARFRMHLTKKERTAEQFCRFTAVFHLRVRHTTGHGDSPAGHLRRNPPVHHAEP